MTIFKSLRKRGALRAYARKLPGLLQEDYGFTRSFTQARVRKTLERHRLNLDHACHAYAMSCTPEDFASYHAAAGETCDYAAMRSEMAATHFHGHALSRQCRLHPGGFQGGLGRPRAPRRRSR